MRQAGIGCSVHFIPIPLHPFYQRHLELGTLDDGELKVMLRN